MNKETDRVKISAKELTDNIDQILDAAYDDLLISDGEGRVIAINATFEKQYGLTRAQTLGKTVYQLEEEGYFKPSIVAKALKEKQRLSLQQKTNTGRDLLVTATPVFDGKGVISFVISYSRDITEMLELQEQVRAYREELERLRGGSKDDVIISASEESKAVVTSMKTMAAYDASVIITGPSGVGKTMYARQIHRQSPRREGPFIEMNCAAIPETLMESELFGYEKGAFTGASEKGKAGLIEMADKGTLFLDEISELSISLQAKLLSVIQDKMVTRVGGVKAKKVDFRLITATNKDLSKAVTDGEFREDLYYRLNVLHLDVLPLKDRKEDIIPLCEYFLDEFNTRYGKNKEFDPKALQRILSYSWPGNVRELSNIVERTAMMTEGDTITDVYFGVDDEAKGHSVTELFEVIDLGKEMETLEKDLYTKAWKKYRSSTKVARALSVSQPTAHRKIKKYKLDYSD